MLRQAVDAATRAVAYTRRRRVVRPAARPVKVNVGSGLLVADGWINVDASINAAVAGAPKAVLGWLYRVSGSSKFISKDAYVETLARSDFVLHDVRYGLPFEDASVDFVFSSHFVEHLDRGQAATFFAEAHRVLRVGGVNRVCIPDLAYAVDLYRRGEKAACLELLYPSVGVGEFARHRSMWDFELLEDALRKAGFGLVERCAYREGRTPDLDSLDNRPEQTLYVEATKSE